MEEQIVRDMKEVDDCTVGADGKKIEMSIIRLLIKKGIITSKEFAETIREASDYLWNRSR